MKHLPRNDPPYPSSALSCIMYACRNILGKMVIDILGQLRHTAFVATCSLIGTYVAHICVTYVQHFLFQASAGG